MEARIYDFDKNYEEYSKWYEKKLMSNISCYELCKKWCEWIQTIPHSGEKALSEFSESLDKLEKYNFNILIKNPLNPLTPISSDFDIIIDSQVEAYVTRLVEQPDYLQEINKQPYYKK